MPSKTRPIVSAACALGLALAPLAAAADPHESDREGHPLEVVGTILYPVGWLLDTLIVKPLHWIGNQEPVSTVVGHEDEE